MSATNILAEVVEEIMTIKHHQDNLGSLENDYMKYCLK